MTPASISSARADPFLAGHAAWSAVGKPSPPPWLGRDDKENWLAGWNAAADEHADSGRHAVSRHQGRARREVVRDEYHGSRE